MRVSLLLGLVVFNLPAYAATGPTITGVNGASGYIGTGTPVVLGGLAGDKVGGTDANSPGNSCAVEPTCPKKPLCPCNTARIYDGLILTINLSNQTTDANGATTTPTVGNAYVTVSSSAGGTTTTANGQTVTLTPTTNGGSSVSMMWSTLCGYAGSSTGCEDVTNGASISLNIYSDTNNNGVDSADPYTAVTVRFLKPDPDTYSTYGYKNSQGIGSFTPYPGDGKIYVKDPQTTTDFPALAYNATIKGVRVFTSETNLTDANPQSASQTHDLPVSDDGASLAKNIVDNLNNGTRYFVRLAMLDEAQNVVMFSPDPAIDTDAAAGECTSPSGATTGGCKYSAIPQKVEGLLPEDLNCFVATAAYGTYLEPKLATFRDFRRRILLTSAFGRRLNHLYYRFGPYGARFLNDRPGWRAATRAALWPAYVVSWLSLRFGFAVVTLALALPLGLGIAVLRREKTPRA